MSRGKGGTRESRNVAALAPDSDSLPNNHDDRPRTYRVGLVISE